MHSVHRLHMHRLPYRSSLCIYVRNRFQNFSRTGLASFFDVQSLAVISDLLAHCVFIYDKCRQPIIWLCSLNDRIHFNRKSFKTLFVSLVYCFFLRNMLLKMRILTTNDSCNNIRHTIVVPDLFMLIPCRILTSLR